MKIIISILLTCLGIAQANFNLEWELDTGIYLGLDTNAYGICDYGLMEDEKVILDFNGDLYNKGLKIEFVKRIREERKKNNSSRNRRAY